MRIDGLDLLRGIALAPPPRTAIGCGGRRQRGVAALAARAVLSVVQLRSHSLTNLLGGPTIVALPSVLPRLTRRTAVAA